MEQFHIAGVDVQYYFESQFLELEHIVDKEKTILLTDTNVMQRHSSKFQGWETIVITPGEAHKNFHTVQSIIEQMIEMEADRSTILIGVGGGVVTDIAGFVASIYMRGLTFAFVPTTLLNMVDASLGGKNGIDFGDYKNMVGRIAQPLFILQDISFLQSLPPLEWSNGFAEIIKHACILDVDMFATLKEKDLSFYQQNKDALHELLKRNVNIKLKIVQEDVYEKGDRKLLNFGHTVGHAIENTYALSHGQAIAIGMVVAANISNSLLGFSDEIDIKNLLEQYQLPTHFDFDSVAISDVLKMDKKRINNDINFILLDAIGKAQIQAISIVDLKQYLKALEIEK